MTLNFVLAVNLLLLICCYIKSSMPYLLFFGEEIAAYSCAITDKWVIKLICGRNVKTSNDQPQVKFAVKNVNEGLYIRRCTVS